MKHALVNQRGGCINTHGLSLCHGTGASGDRPTRHNRRREHPPAIIYSFLPDVDRGETVEERKWNSFQLQENNAKYNVQQQCTRRRLRHIVA